MTDRNHRSNANEDGSQSEEKHGTRRIGSLLTLVAVCVATVIVGFFVGRYVIQGVMHDAFGLIPLHQQTTEPVVSAEQELRIASSGSHLRGNNEKEEGDDEHEAVPASGTTAPSASQQTGSFADVDERSTSSAESSAGEEERDAARDKGADSQRQTALAPPVAIEADAAEQKVEPVAGVSEQREQSGTSSPGNASGVASRNVLYRVQVGSFNERDEANDTLVRLQSDYPDAFVVVDDEFRVQIGAFSSEQSADDVVSDLEKQGFAPVHKIRVEL